MDGSGIVASKDNEQTQRAGVNFVGYRVENFLGWIFREQPTSDYGVDAHVEIRDGDVATGRLVGARIKTGESYPTLTNQTMTDGFTGLLTDTSSTGSNIPCPSTYCSWISKRSRSIGSCSMRQRYRRVRVVESTCIFLRRILSR